MPAVSATGSKGVHSRTSLVVFSLTDSSASAVYVYDVQNPISLSYNICSQFRLALLNAPRWRSMMLAALVLLIVLNHVPVHAMSDGITGTVDSANVGDALPYLQVVVRSETGAIVECVPVTSQLTFTLYRVLGTDGFYIVQLSGSTEWEFTPFIITLSKGNLSAAYRRLNPLELPSRIQRANDNLTIHFTSTVPTMYVPVRAQWNLASLFSFQRVFFVAALAFIVSFPHFFRQLPREVREELIGEKEADTGDPNRVTKALFGEPLLAQT